MPEGHASVGINGFDSRCARQIINQLKKEKRMSMMHTWFECKVRYEKTLGNGTRKRVTEVYLVDALNFTEAENWITEETRPFIGGPFKVADIKRANYSELFGDDSEEADKWYKCKVAFVTIDERGGHEKRTNTYILVRAGSLRAALERLDEGMKGSLSDWEVTSIAETAVMDVYPYEADGNDGQTKAMAGGTNVTAGDGDVKAETTAGAIRDFHDGLKDADPLLGKVADYLREKKAVGRTEFGIVFGIGVKRVAKIVSQLLVRGMIDADCDHVLTYREDGE